MSVKKLFVANWKMYKTLPETLAFIHEFLPLVQKSEDEIWIAPPFTALALAAKAAGKVLIGAQDLHEGIEGAFTGEVSGEMLKDAGAKFVIVGHSERRGYYGESNELVNKKLKAALHVGLIPILCIGESLDDRESDSTEAALEAMLEGSLEGISEPEMKKIVVAYEPKWAIGTGVVATPDMAEGAHVMIRHWIHDKWSLECSNAVKILYGGSVKPENSSSLLACKNIDGFLIGGAALSPISFARIVNNANTFS